jgi:CAP-Gly domain-containing linker protein 1
VKCVALYHVPCSLILLLILQDELEQEIERLNEKLRKASSKRSGKSSSGPNAGDTSPAATAAPSPLKHNSSLSNGSASLAQISKTNGTATVAAPAVANGDEPVCEICEKPGHDIFSCDLLREDYGHHDASSDTKLDEHVADTLGHDGEVEEGEGELDIWCEECEGHGHRADQCPYAEDVF